MPRLKKVNIISFAPIFTIPSYMVSYFWLINNIKIPCFEKDKKLLFTALFYFIIVFKWKL